jgi:acetyl-CoA C-acetyltransferase
MQEAFIAGAAVTEFGRIEGSSPLSLMSRAASQAVLQASIQHNEIDGVLVGYATTMPHLMLANLFCESFGLMPHYAHAVQAGGATGAAMVMLARDLVRVGRCKNVLVVAGENRLTGQGRDNAMNVLAQVGHAETEVPLGLNVPGYYALIASRYMHEFGITEADLAAFAVLMRTHANATAGAHLGSGLPISIDDVLRSKPIATPLKLLDCCPVSDGAAAIIVSATPSPVRISGAGQAHLHQHVSTMRNVTDTGARRAADRAWREAGVGLTDFDTLAIYDSFTITLCLLLEELGFAPRGGAAARVRAGDFSANGKLPLNTHGGLLGYGHCGVAGGMAHIVEAIHLLGAGRTRAAVHGDGGVLSAHVHLVLERA